VLIHRSLAMRIPPNLSFEEAAAIPVNWLVAYDALVNRAEVKRGQAVLIHAVGSGVGIAALQIAREKGCTVFGTAGSAEKLGKAAELGLHVGINYRSEDFAAVVHERTDGAGVHAILDMVGGSYYTANVASLRYLGRLVFLGNMGGAKFEGDVMPFLNKRLSAIGSHLRSRALDERSALTAQLRDDILPLFESGKLRSIVDRAFPIEKVGDAHRYLESQANFGKVVITLS
jgi:NADPH:quinone reductase-like Zn-dependent oxidoreductase